MGKLRDKGTQLYLWIRAESSITDLIDTIGSSPAIIVDKKIDEAYQDLKHIQIYRTSIVTPVQVQPINYTVNCRSSTDYKADELAQAVYDVINRKLKNGYLAKCTVNPNIPESENIYNTPIDVVVF